MNTHLKFVDISYLEMARYFEESIDFEKDVFILKINTCIHTYLDYWERLPQSEQSNKIIKEDVNLQFVPNEENKLYDYMAALRFANNKLKHVKIIAPTDVEPPFVSQ